MISLNKSDKYAIELLYSKNKTIEEIAKELKLTDKQVKRVIDKLPKEEPKTISQETKTDKTKNLMIRQTSAKKSNTVSIMTEGASQLGDDFIKGLPTSTPNNSSYIYRRPE